jgi:hypothetical protein
VKQAFIAGLALLAVSPCTTPVRQPNPPELLYERVAAKLVSRPDLASLDQPPRELEGVRWMIGHWDVEATVFATASTPERVERGSSEVRTVMKGYWLEQADTYPEGTQDLGFLTYNPVEREWVSLGLDSTGNCVVAKAAGWQ